MQTDIVTSVPACARFSQASDCGVPRWAGTTITCGCGASSSVYFGCTCRPPVIVSNLRSGADGVELELAYAGAFRDCRVLEHFPRSGRVDHIGVVAEQERNADRAVLWQRTSRRCGGRRISESRVKEPD